jgi:hypothetical protein
VYGGYPLRMIDVVEQAGHLSAATGRPAEAVTLWSAATTQCEAAGLVEPLQETGDRERPLAEARRALDDRQFAAAESRGPAAQGRTDAQIAGAALHQRPHRAHSPGPDPR